jgi:ABC-type bacteriocin/lantibiotic exporter with double-glycine peptidase domain
MRLLIGHAMTVPRATDGPAPAGGQPGARPSGSATGRFRAQAVEHHLNSDGFGPVFDAGQPAQDRLSVRHRLGAVISGLKRRPRRRGARIPVCLQTQESDCGPAALTMMLRHRGVDAGFEDIRTLVNAGRNGATARTLLEIARSHGVPGRGVRTGLDGLARLTPGAILFWNFRHFVVLEAAGRNHVDIVDPAFGRRRLTRASAGQSFTGVALEFEQPVAAPGRAAAPADRQPSPWRQLVQFRPRGRTLAFLVVTSVLLLGFELALPLTTAYFVDHVLPGKVPGKLPLLSAGLCLLSLLFVVLTLARSLLVVRQQSYLEKRLTIGVMDHMLSLPYHYFQVRNSGDLAMRLRAATILNQIVSIAAVSAAFDSIMIFLYTGLIIAADPILAGLVIALVLAELAVLRSGWRRQVRLGPEVMELQTQTQDGLTEILTTIGTLKSEGVEDQAAQRWSHLLVQEVNKRLSVRRSLAGSSALSSLLQFGAPLLVLCAGTVRVFDGGLSEGNLLGFTALTVVLFVPLSGMFSTALQLVMIRPTMARVDDILRTRPDSGGAAASAVIGEPGRIAAEGVSFTYPGAAAPALSDVSLSVRPGEFVAVTGRSGSGKSTLAMLLAGLYPPGRGTITVDGVDLRDTDRAAFRRQIGYVHQDARLYHGTIADNIAFGAGGADRATLRRAVELARVHDEITALPMGYDTLVTSSGTGLSGGQRQRIVLARALAKRPRLLVLDEATSALDPALEEEIFRGLIGTGLTLIVAAHRLTVIDAADQVIELRGGRVAAAGPSQDLAPAAGSSHA